REGRGRRGHPAGRAPAAQRRSTMRQQARRLMIFINENDQYHHRPLYAEIVDRAHRMGLAGATVLRGIEGYGHSSQIHTSRLLSLSEAQPVTIIIVDDAERIE